MISILKRCPDCGKPIRVFPGDEFAECENSYCGESFKVIRDGDDVTLRHLYHQKRPETETRLDMFTQELLL